MKIKKINRIKLDSPEKFYDITVENYHNFIIGDSKIVCHNSSLSQAICKLARPFGCSDQILLGDGFFGTPVNPSPSAPRYTQVKISSKYKDIIEKYKDLNQPNEEGGFDWIHVDYPIGLSTHIVGIAVGYKSNILPRKPDELITYLDGNKTKKLKPYFRGFKGKITRVDSLKSAWLIEGETEIDLNSRTFKIDSISPLQRYESFFTRLNLALEKTGLNYKIDNFSTEEVKISIKFRCTDQEFKNVCEVLLNYLEDFIVHKEQTVLKRFERDLVYLQDELDFLEAKLKFLLFMSEKKRAAQEVLDFLAPFKKEISRRLESISLTKLTKDEIEKTKQEINSCKSDIKNKNLEIKTQKSKVLNIEKEHKRISKKSSRTTSLMSETKEEFHNGIRIWDPENEIDPQMDQELETNIENE